MSGWARPSSFTFGSVPDSDEEEFIEQELRSRSPAHSGYAYGETGFPYRTIASEQERMPKHQRLSLSRLKSILSEGLVPPNKQTYQHGSVDNNPDAGNVHLNKVSSDDIESSLTNKDRGGLSVLLERAQDPLRREFGDLESKPLSDEEEQQLQIRQQEALNKLPHQLRERSSDSIQKKLREDFLLERATKQMNKQKFEDRLRNSALAFIDPHHLSDKADEPSTSGEWVYPGKIPPEAIRHLAIPEGAIPEKYFPERGGTRLTNNAQKTVSFKVSNSDTINFPGLSAPDYEHPIRKAISSNEGNPVLTHMVRLFTESDAEGRSTPRRSPQQLALQSPRSLPSPGMAAPLTGFPIDILEEGSEEYTTSHPFNNINQESSRIRSQAPPPAGHPNNPVYSPRSYGHQHPVASLNNQTSRIRSQAPYPVWNLGR